MRPGNAVIRSTLRCTVLAIALAIGTGAPALVDARTNLETEPLTVQAIAGCTEETHGRLEALRDEIAASPSVEEARSLVLAESSLARRAVATARWVAPSSEDLRLAATRIQTFESRVSDASTPSDVADAFDRFVVVALADDDTAVGVDIGNKGCSYSTGETIAIVLGLILGIIPGIILLILLC